MTYDHDPTLTVAELIRRHQDATRESYNDIAKRGDLSKPKVGEAATRTNRQQLRPETIYKLAKGLRLPVRVVQRAALATAGLDDPDSPMSPEIELIAARLQTLDPRTVRLIGAMVDAATREELHGQA